MRQRIAWLPLGVWIVLWLMAPFLTASRSSAEAMRQRPAPKALNESAPPTYLIHPGDVLDISVWKEPTLSVKATVRFDGKISIPLAGDVDAVDRTPRQLAAELQKELSRFVELPQVTVLVDAVNSARYFVIGKVANQGAFAYRGPLTVVQALALAGGFQDFAKKDKILVIREAKGEQTVLRVDYEKLVADGDLSFNISVLPGDTIVVP